MAMLLALSLLGNAAVVAVALWVWLAGRRNIAERLYVLPNRLRRQSFFDRYPIVPGDVVLLGDSLTANAQWSEVFPGAPVKNRGVGGDTTATLLDRIGQVTAGRPATVLLMVGTNDLSLGVPHGRIVTNYDAILHRLRTESPETAVVVQSVLPRGRAYVDRIRNLNAALARLAAAHGCRFVDLTPGFASPTGAIQAELSDDELHLLGRGYVVWRRAIAPYVVGAG
jgi:lysophospholipase L1-like esterase